MIQHMNLTMVVCSVYSYNFIHPSNRYFLRISSPKQVQCVRAKRNFEYDDAKYIDKFTLELSKPSKPDATRVPATSELQSKVSKTSSP